MVRSAGAGDEWRPSGREDLVFRRVGEEWLLFDPRTREMHVLNLSAALVWSHCTGEHAVGEIVASTRDAFRGAGAGEGAEVDREVRRILDRFESAGLLE